MLEWNSVINPVNDTELTSTPHKQAVNGYDGHAMHRGQGLYCSHDYSKHSTQILNEQDDSDDDSTGGSTSGRVSARYSLRTIKKASNFFKGHLGEHSIFNHPIEEKIDKTLRRKQAEKRNKDTKQQIRKIIKKAERRISDKKLSSYERKLAIQHFNEIHKNAHSYKELAMIALLSVIYSLMNSKGLKSMSQVNWANQWMDPEVISNLGGTFTLEQINHFSPDPNIIGLDVNAISAMLSAPNFLDDFTEFLEKNGCYFNPSTNTFWTTDPTIIRFDLPAARL
ncbi:MAG: hypothetical protein ABIH77_00385 [Pseudomonadota bacterium]|nr:hypothetical protein [Gammaproteobacteria bacterium]MBU1628903.1 hypothetical protein [Gammaproteobacteria bacterium]MBU2545782.1 hypothetical protein [Gammaproteobacteria bacterium]